MIEFVLIFVTTIVITAVALILVSTFKGSPVMKYCPRCGSELIEWREDGAIHRGFTVSRDWRGCPHYRDDPSPGRFDHYATWRQGTDASPFDPYTGAPR